MALRVVLEDCKNWGAAVPGPFVPLEVCMDSSIVMVAHHSWAALVRLYFEVGSQPAEAYSERMCEAFVQPDRETLVVECKEKPEQGKQLAGSLATAYSWEEEYFRDGQRYSSWDWGPEETVGKREKIRGNYTLERSRLNSNDSERGSSRNQHQEMTNYDFASTQALMITLKLLTSMDENCTHILTQRAEIKSSYLTTGRHALGKSGIRHGTI
jgi:hypothetical protein